MHHDEPVACGGFFTAAAGIAEIKRLWFAPSSRGRGLAYTMLNQLETLARQAGHERVQLDANATLIEAIALYRRSGYGEVEAFNENPYAHYWFEKKLA